MNKYEKSVLDLLAYTEGTLGVSQNGYNVTVNYYKIVGWTDDTNIAHGNLNWKQKIGKLKKKTGEYVTLYSTAAGRYQYIYKSWVAINGKNIPMTKVNQDKAAIKSINNRLKQTDLESRSVKLNELEDKEKFFIFLNKIAREWASIPLSKTFIVEGKKVYKGSSYYSSDGVNTAKKTPDILYDVFIKALKIYENK